MPVHTHSAFADTQGNHQHSVAEYAGQSAWSNHVQASINAGLAGSLTSVNGAHSHNIGINNTGGSSKHNNMQPYLIVNIWKRKD